MSASTTPETLKARKTHCCTWCYEHIEIGETYTRYCWFDRECVGTVKMHPECLSAMQDMANDEGGNIVWTPGEFERPKVQA